jgi:hypothetical protein
VLGFRDKLDALKIGFDLYRLGEKEDVWIPKEFQAQIDSRFRTLNLDYEYDIFPAIETRLKDSYETVLARHLERLKHPPSDAYKRRKPPFEKPELVQVGDPFPEVYRQMAPGIPRHNAYPFSPTREWDKGLVPEAKAVIRSSGNLWIYEAAIPWTELQHVPRNPGDLVRFTFFVVNDNRRVLGWSENRSRSLGRKQLIFPFNAGIDQVETEWRFIE